MIIFKELEIKNQSSFKIFYKLCNKIKTVVKGNPLSQLIMMID